MYDYRPTLFTVNQQILAAIKFGVSQNKVIWQLLNLAAIKFGVSQNKVIWQLLNLASPPLCSARSTYNHVSWRDK